MKVVGRNFARRHKIDDGKICHEIKFETSDVKACDDFFVGNKDTELIVEIKRKQRKKSMNANAYFWTLADQLAHKLLTTKEEVYKEIIQRVGVFKYALVKKDDKNDIIKEWQHNGIGWVALEEYYDSKEYVQLRLYKGSSVYTQSEFSRLLDELISECKEAGIDTITPNEKEELIQRWGVKN